MDALDLVLLVVLAAAAVHGLRLGALVQVFTFGGFLVGLTLGVLLALALGASVQSPVARQVLVVALVIGLAVLFGVTGRVVGGWSYVLVRRHHLGQVDSVLGVGVSVVAVLLSAWLVANVVASNSSDLWLDSAVHRSEILRSVDRMLPPVPSLFARVQSFLDAEGFPAVFVNLSGPNAPGVPLPSASAARRMGAPAAFSTVKVIGDACGYQQEGTGFVVGPSTVVTNAHVVAGERLTQVVTGGNGYRATVVLYDPAFDLAVLRTGAPLGPPLTLSDQIVPRGTQGAVLGYPENGPLTVGPAGVTANVVAQGRDIYNSGLVTRDFYEIDATVLPGNSGGPLMAGGRVVGVVFSRSTVYQGVGYALASPGVAQRVALARGRTAAVSTGACVTG